MRNVLRLLGVVMFSFFITACDKSVETNQESTFDGEIRGSLEFISSIRSLNLTPTRAGEVSEKDVLDAISPMYPMAIDYLSKNGYDYHEDFLDGDPNIIMTALALYDCDLNNLTVTTRGTITSVLSCVALGSDLGCLVGMGAKAATRYLAKEVTKAALKRAIPGVGIAVGIVSAALCLSEI